MVWPRPKRREALAPPEEELDHQQNPQNAIARQGNRSRFDVPQVVSKADSGQQHGQGARQQTAAQKNDRSPNDNDQRGDGDEGFHFHRPIIAMRGPTV